jgi:very-short-patch-repair endonuclease
MAQPPGSTRSAYILLACLSIGLALLDMLSLLPGSTGKLTPLVIGSLLLIVVAAAEPDIRGRLMGWLGRQQDQPSVPVEATPPPSPSRSVAAPLSGRDRYREIHWHGLVLHSKSEAKIAKELDLAGALFLAGIKIRLTTGSDRQTREVDFLVCHHGQWGVLEVDGPHHAPAADSWRDARFGEHGVRVSRFPSAQCYENPRAVVQTFLTSLQPSRHPSAPANTPEKRGS